MLRCGRVLFFVHSFWPQIGGVETITADLTVALRRRGHDVSVLTHRGPGLAEFDELKGVMIRRVDLFGGFLEQDVNRLAAARRAVRLAIQDERPDLLHVIASPVTAYFVSSTLRANRVPLLVASHGFWAGSGQQHPPAEAALLERAIHVTATSHDALGQVHAAAPGTFRCSSVVLNGLDPGPVAPVTLPAGPARITAIGRMVSEKGLDVLVAAFERLLTRHPGARLRLVGGGEMRGALENQIRDLGLGHAVELPGWARPSGVRTELDAATMVVMPSTTASESFGLVALEAALRERPVIASRIGGLAEVVEDGVTGLLVPPSDPDALSAALVELSDDPRRAMTLGKAGRQRALRDFSASQMVDAHERLYGKLLAGKS